MRRSLLVTSIFFLAALVASLALHLYTSHSGPARVIRLLVSDIESGQHFSIAALEEFTAEERGQASRAGHVLLERVESGGLDFPELEGLLEYIEDAYDDAVLSPGELRTLTHMLGEF